MDNDELETYGIRAYQSGEYSYAIDYLGKLLNRDPKRWMCRLYLAMAYAKSGKEGHARQEFDTIVQFSTDNAAKRNAITALKAMYSVSVPNQTAS